MIFHDYPEFPVLKEIVVETGRPRDFLIRVRVHKHFMEFAAYSCVGVGDARYYDRAGAGCSSDITEDVADAQVFLRGSIKWDGCCNIRFDEQDEHMLHFCGRGDAARVGKLIDRLYDIAAEIPAWDEELGE